MKRAEQRGYRDGTMGKSQRRTRGKGERGEKRGERDVEIKEERELVGKKRERGEEKMMRGRGGEERRGEGEGFGEMARRERRRKDE